MESQFIIMDNRGETKPKLIWLARELNCSRSAVVRQLIDKAFERRQHMKTIAIQSALIADLFDGQPIVEKKAAVMVAPTAAAESSESPRNATISRCLGEKNFSPSSREADS